MRQVYRFVSLLYLLLLCMITNAQSSLDSLVIRASMVGKLFPQEKVYLHFDNNSYYLGETMWFKAYVIGTGQTSRPLSKVLYVELLAPEGYVVETKKYKLNENGCCRGEFELKESLLSGYYTVRSYTRYMLNWGDEAVFSRTFPIYDAVYDNQYEIKNILDRKLNTKRYENVESEETSKAHLAFYPEGGHLVSGVKSVVAYELLQNSDCHTKDSIIIFENGRVLLRTLPIHDGKGLFEIYPQTGFLYHAEIKCWVKDKKGKLEECTYKYDLPKVEERGAVIAVKEEEEHLTFSVRNTLTNDMSLAYTILHQGQVCCYDILSQSDKQKFCICKDSLPEGVNRIVLFTERGIPLSERQFFVSHDSHKSNSWSPINLCIVADTVFSSGGNSKMQKLFVKREDGGIIPRDTELSLSVLDSCTSEEIGQGNNLYYHLLLVSELKGYIPNVTRYFDSNNTNRLRELDLIMLVHGWTSYDWEKLTGTYYTLNHPIERGITINGELLEVIPEKNKSKRSKKGQSFLFVPMKNHPMNFYVQKDSLLQNYVFSTGEDGSFQIMTEDFYGSKVVALSSDKLPDKNLSTVILLDKFFPQETLIPNYHTIFQDESQIGVSKVSDLSYSLPNLEVVNKKSNKFLMPPLSEVSFNYLNEWERNYEEYWRLLRRTGLVGIKEDSICTAGDGLYYMAPIHCYIDKRGQVYIGDYGTQPYKVIGATFLRNFGGCYWIHYAVSSQKYSSDTICFDEDILMCTDYLNPFNFKEFVVHSDYSIRSKISKDLSWWINKYNSISDKHKSSFVGGGETYYHPKGGLDYYHGFCMNQILPPINLMTNASAYNRFREEAMGSAQFIYQANRGEWYVQGHLPLDVPNYVVQVIPYTDEERKRLYIPDGKNSGERRFTHLQGYSYSKQFYAPDYRDCDLPSVNRKNSRTLFWDTELKPDSIGNINISFSTPACTENIMIVIEGIHEKNIFRNCK